VDDTIIWTFGELEAVLSGVHGIDQTKRTAFQSRLKNFHRLHYPIGFTATKGKAAVYSPLQIIDMAFAVEMTQLGLPPERAIWVLTCNRWATLMAVQMAARELAKNPRGFDIENGLADDLLSMFIYFDPAALHPLTLHVPPRLVPDLDQAANSFFYGGIGVVQENMARWTSGMVPRISLINVTAMVGSVVASPYEAGSPKDVSYRQRLFEQLDAEAFAIRRDWGGGEEAEADYVLGLLEREEITDPIKLGERVGISPERAARYIHEEAERKVRRTYDGNT
jgi:hypothetical protein